MRNPLTGLLRKKSRRSTTLKRRSTFSSTPNERVASKIILEYISLFMQISTVFAALSAHSMLLSNTHTTRTFLRRSRVNLDIANRLIDVDSSISDVRICNHVIFREPLINLRIDDFQNNDQYKL